MLDPEPIIPPDILDLAGRLSRRFFSSWGELLRPAVPPALSGASSMKVSLTEPGRAALAAGSLSREEARIAGLLAIKEHSPSFFKRKSVAAGGPAVLSRLIRKGFAETRTVEKKTVRRAVPAVLKFPVQMDLDFSIHEAAARAAADVAAAANKGRFLSRLFFGPPDRRASAYLACVRDVLARGRQVLFLYPEIGMSEAVSAAFASGVGERIVLLHSRLSAKRPACGPQARPLWSWPARVQRSSPRWSGWGSSSWTKNRTTLFSKRKARSMTPESGPGCALKRLPCPWSSARRPRRSRPLNGPGATGGW